MRSHLTSDLILDEFMEQFCPYFDKFRSRIADEDEHGPFTRFGVRFHWPTGNPPNPARFVHVAKRNAEQLFQLLLKAGLKREATLVSKPPELPPIPTRPGCGRIRSNRYGITLLLTSSDGRSADITLLAKIECP